MTTTGTITGYLPGSQTAEFQPQGAATILNVKIETDANFHYIINKTLIGHLVDVELEPRTPSPNAPEAERNITHAITNIQPHRPAGGPAPRIRWRRQDDRLLADPIIIVHDEYDVTRFTVNLRISAETDETRLQKWISATTITEPMLELMSRQFRRQNYELNCPPTDYMRHPSLEQAVQYAELLTTVTRQEMQRQTDRRDARRHAVRREMDAYLHRHAAPAPADDAPRPAVNSHQEFVEYMESGDCINKSLLDVNAVPPPQPPSPPRPYPDIGAEQIHARFQDYGEPEALRTLLTCQPEIRKHLFHSVYILGPRDRIIHDQIARKYIFQWPGVTAVKTAAAAPMFDYPDEDHVKTAALLRIARETNPSKWAGIDDPAMTQFPRSLLHHLELDQAVRQAISHQMKHEEHLTELLEEAAASAVQRTLELLPEAGREHLVQRLERLQPQSTQTGG